MNKLPASDYIIRFGDCDPFGHLNNARYIDYFMNAREDHLRENYTLTLDTYHKQGYGWVVGGHEIRYLKPARYNEAVKIQSQLIDVQPDLLLAELCMFDQEGKHLKSIMWSSFYFIDLKTGKKDTHPRELMDFLKSLQNETVATDVKITDRIRFYRSMQSM